MTIRSRVPGPVHGVWSILLVCVGCAVGATDEAADPFDRSGEPASVPDAGIQGMDAASAAADDGTTGGNAQTEDQGTSGGATSSGGGGATSSGGGGATSSGGGAAGGTTGNEPPDVSAPDAGVDAAAPVCEPAACADAFACTVDGCAADGKCTHTPRDTLCDNGATCSVTQGCVAPACAESPCRLLSPQCGCATGKGCYPLPSGQLACQAAGAKVEGEECRAMNDCAPGLLCVPTGGTPSVCKVACASDAQCLGDGSLCQDTPAGKACTVSCDLAKQTGCAATTYCALGQETDGAERFFSDCWAPRPASGGKQGASCSISECAPGFACFVTTTATSSVASCFGICETNQDCTGLDECLSDPPIAVGATVYGLCQ